jgi:hypothetical protein
MIVIENGTADGAQAGMAPARQRPTTVCYQVAQAPGTLIHYIRNISHHDQYGHTGILRGTD